MDPEKVVTIKLLLVRHGETDDNHIKVICGHRATNLTELGVEQAQKTGTYLRNHTFDQIFVSDLLRTKQTYQSILENAPNLEKIPTDFIALIRERCGGVLEGQPLVIWGENAKAEGKPIREYKCEKGESWKDVNQRGKQFLKLLIRNYTKDQSEKEVKVMAVSHGGFIMEFHNICRTLTGEEEVFSNTAKNCSLHEFQITYPCLEEYDPKNIKMKCTIKNFANHLE